VQRATAGIVANSQNTDDPTTDSVSAVVMNVW
jgi:hypothetical protein